MLCEQYRMKGALQQSDESMKEIFGVEYGSRSV